MSAFGELAVAVAEYCKLHPEKSPVDEWKRMAKRSFPANSSMRTKSCPKSAFLGLCEDGYLMGVPPGKYTRSVENKTYAIAATRALFKNSLLKEDRTDLWCQATANSGIKQNGQLDVVIALWDAKLVRQPPKP